MSIKVFLTFSSDRSYTFLTKGILWILWLLLLLPSHFLAWYHGCIRHALVFVSCSVMAKHPLIPRSLCAPSVPVQRCFSACYELLVMRCSSHSILFPSTWHRAWHAVNPFSKCCKIKLMTETMSFTSSKCDSLGQREEQNLKQPWKL